MEHSVIEKRARRAVRRLMADAVSRWDDAVVADRRFDGGEWSDAAIVRGVQRDCDRAVRLVADRFELSEYAVEVAVAELDGQECDRHMAALMGE